jgi:hypothetical protein
MLSSRLVKTRKASGREARRRFGDTAATGPSVAHCRLLALH